jgi:hypothetical protein
LIFILACLYIFVLLVFSFKCLFQCLFVCLFISFVFPFSIYLLFMLYDYFIIFSLNVYLALKRDYHILVKQEKKRENTWRWHRFNESRLNKYVFKKHETVSKKYQFQQHATLNFPRPIPNYVPTATKIDLCDIYNINWILADISGFLYTLEQKKSFSQFRFKIILCWKKLIF